MGDSSTKLLTLFSLPPPPPSISYPLFLRSFSQLFCAASAKTIQIEAGDDFEASCLKVVEPGDTCYLAKGNYLHDGLTVTHGTKDKPITITGDSGACIKGSNTQDRALQIAHDYYTIEGICFDGEHGDEYVATAIYVLGADKKSTKNGVTSSVTGLKMYDLEIKVSKGNLHRTCNLVGLTPYAPWRHMGTPRTENTHKKSLARSLASG